MCDPGLNTDKDKPVLKDVRKLEYGLSIKVYENKL